MTEDGVELVVDTRELEAALRAMPRKFAGAAMREALQAGGDVLLEAIEAHAPERNDTETPGSDALPPGVLKADLHTEVVISTQYAPRVKVGPSPVTGHVARWQNNGFNLTTRGRSRASRKVIRAIPGLHFLEAGFDEAAETAVDVFCATLAEAVFGGGSALEGVGAESKSPDVEFD